MTSQTLNEQHVSELVRLFFVLFLNPRVSHEVTTCSCKHLPLCRNTEITPKSLLTGQIFKIISASVTVSSRAT